MSTQPAEWRAPPTWVIEKVLIPAIEAGIAKGEITVLNGSTQEQFIRQLRRIFVAALKLRREGIPLNFETLARELTSPEQKMRQARLKAWLGKIEDWNWMIDDVRLRESDRGGLPIEGSTMILKGDAYPDHKGASIFGVASRSIPANVMKALKERGLAPIRNPSPHSTATDCSAWLVEVAEAFTLALRVEALTEDTWFHPEKYERELGPEHRKVAEEVLHRTHGFYETSTRKVVGTEMLGSYLNSVTRLRGSAAGLTFESGCIPQGIWGKSELFIGSRLDQALAIETHGARAFFDLARLSPDDQQARRRPDRKPWSGNLSVGEVDCLFSLEDNREPRERWEMAYGASVALGIVDGRPEVEGIFRPANERAVREGSSDPDNANYAIAQARVGKAGTRQGGWPSVGFLVGSCGGAVPSGFSIPFGDLRQPSLQRKAIEMAESHLRRVGPEGQFHETLERHRKAGVQGAQARIRSHIQALHGLILVTEILDLRARLYI
jgi:hypothetical protein